MSEKMEADRFRLIVTKKILMFIAGLMWLLVGVMLLNYARLWLSLESGKIMILYSGAGVLSALIIHHFGFLRVADKNLQRIFSMKERVSVFSFLTWKSYILIAVMITMGITLRHSAIPKKYLAVLYIGIGLALALSSIRYIRFFIKELILKGTM